MSQLPSTAASRNGGWFVLIAVFIDMVGVGIANPVLAIMLGDYVDSHASQDYWYGILIVSYGMMQFLFAPLMGIISDRYGRKPVLIAAIVGMGLHYILIAVAPNLWVMLLARVLGGITGASFTVANAYLADITPPEDRAKIFGRVGAVFGLGFICGPLIGGFLGEVDLHLPFFVAAALSLLNAFYGWFAVPESLPLDRRTEFRWARANPFRALIALVQHHAVGRMVVVYSLFIVGHMMMIQTWVLFTHFRFGWGTLENGLLMFGVGVLAAVTQGVFMGRLVKALGEERLALIAIGTNVFVQISYGVSPNGVMMFVTLFCGFIVFTAGPAIQGLVSKSGDAMEQGFILGSLQAISSLAAVIGPAVGTAILAQVSVLPPFDIRVGSSFFLIAALNAAAFIVAWRGLPKKVPSAQ